MTYTKHHLIFGTAIVVLLLGAGCKNGAPPPTPDGGLKPAATTEQPADPLADDLDTAIEELQIIDGVTE